MTVVLVVYEAYDATIVIIFWKLVRVNYLDKKVTVVGDVVEIIQLGV